MLEILTQQLADRQTLTDTEVARAVEALTQPDVAPHIKADFLTALARKGEAFPKSRPSRGNCAPNPSRRPWMRKPARAPCWMFAAPAATG